MTSTDPLVSLVHFTLTGAEHALVETPAAEHRLKPAQWIKSCALELARTVAENRAAKSERRDHHQKN